MSLNITSKEVLARLMANENITVVHKKTETASFDVKNRVLTLPQWKDMGNETYDHLVGHEVGHSLYTPADEWFAACKDKDEGYRSFVNVIEDARIEKLIQRRYPGLRRSFIKSYRKMLADGFFGKDEAEINNFKLIDRLNVFFKCGASLGVEFSSNERDWVKKIENAETFQDVLNIANGLYGDASEEYEKEQEIKRLAMFGEDGEGEDDEEDGDEVEIPFGGGNDDDFEDAEEIETDEESDDTFVGQGAGEQEVDGPLSETDRALQQNIFNTFVDGNIEVNNFFLNDCKIDGLIEDYKQIIEKHSTEEYADLREAGAEMFKNFNLNSKNSINYMVKEFEMRKSAAAYSRAKIAKTGVIDSVKMNNYKFSDDIFRKMTVLPEGKNNGMIMFIDWSGSMAEHLKNTFDQLLNMVLFCKQVNIPFEVYAFTDRRSNNNSQNFSQTQVDNQLMYSSEFGLMKFFDNKMNRKQLSEMAGILLATATYFNSRKQYSINYDLWLGGTPLAETIMAAFKVYENFKKSNRCDIVNTIFLTDGDGDYIDVAFQNQYGVLREARVGSFFSTWKDTTKIVNLVDPVTKKSYRANHSNDISATLLKMYRDRTGETVIGYRLVPSTKGRFISQIGWDLGYSEKYTAWEELKKHRFTTIKSKAYDEYFLILGGKNLETSNGEIEVASDASKAKIRSAFRKANTGKRESRVLLSKFIEKIA